MTQSDTSSIVDVSLFVSALASAALLGGAHIFEALGYHPCSLCLDQREAHWTALAVSLAGLATARLAKAPAAAAAAVGATAFVYGVSAGLAFFHTGVEFGYWPPLGCDAATGVDGPLTIEKFDAALSGELVEASCTEPSWRLFGVSMAGYNLLFSAGLFVLCLAGAVVTTRVMRASR